MVTQKPDGSVEFRFFRPEANRVTLAGEFNGWNKDCFPMIRSEDGWWHYRVSLAAGCYQFRYVADGAWHTDYAAFGLEHTALGWNSVVKVDPILPEQRPVTKPPQRLRSLTAELAEVLASVRPDLTAELLAASSKRVAPQPHKEHRHQKSEELALAAS